MRFLRQIRDQPQNFTSKCKRKISPGVSTKIEYLQLPQSLAEGCSAIYVVIDALGECIDAEGEHVWDNLITRLKGAVPGLYLFCTSREIRGIGENVEIQADEATIKAYILARIEATRLWPVHGFPNRSAVHEHNLRRRLIAGLHSRV